MADEQATPRKKAAQKYADELRSLYEEHGSLNPADVVEWARLHPESALHGRFTWDDTKAAHEYRLWQARQVITEVEVVWPDGKTRQAYVSEIPRRGKEGYSALVEVISDEERRAMFLAQALDEYERVGAKYADLQELTEVRASVARVKRPRE